MTRQIPLAVSIADAPAREAIYAIRHDVYARELHQHPENTFGTLQDNLDDVNVYVVARDGPTVAGFVAITPPGAKRYSIDKYFDRVATGLPFDDGLYEVRLLTVVDAYRHTQLAAVLMYAAYRYIESAGGTTIVAIGREELLALYERVGLRRRGLRTKAGAVTYELLSADVATMRAPAWEAVIRRMDRTVDWRLPGVPLQTVACYHGGAFWSRVGDRFDALGQRGDVISADVLDAWFDPAPSVVQSVSDNLAFLLKTSPPTHAEGLRRTIADVRGVPEDSVLAGAGSSDLIFAAFRQWIAPSSSVLILDPMYGEYAHVLEGVVRAKVERLTLNREQHFDVDLESLEECLTRGFDWVVLVNPNSPTGRHIPFSRLEGLLEGAHPATRIWIDETYVDYVDPGQSLERVAAVSDRLVVCKSMSKAYALSGVRVAYLVGPASLIEELRPACPPWAVSLPAQVAACEALRASSYYESKWLETRALRQSLAKGLETLGCEVTPGCANFLLCHLPSAGRTASDVICAARTHGLFIRDVSSMGKKLGPHAFRIAVKDARTNARMLNVLADVLAVAGVSLSR